MKLTLILPWPSRRLSPNARGAWQTKEAPRQAAIDTGYLAARKTGQTLSRKARLSMLIEAHPPKGNRSDWDNLVGRLKHYQDGVCKALAVNDNQIKEATVLMCEPHGDGSVIITIEEI